MSKDNEFKSLKKIQVHPIVSKAGLVTFIIISFIIFIMFLPWQQTVKGVGEVIAYNPTERNYNIYAPIGGFIEDYYVQEDTFVKKGTVLFSMKDLDPKYEERLKNQKNILIKQIQNISSQIDVLTENKKNLEKSIRLGLEIYNNKITQARNKIEALTLKKVSLEKNFEINKENYERIKALFKEGIESKRRLELAENSFVKAKVELQKINIDLDIQKRNLDILEKEKGKFLNESNIKLNKITKEIITARNKINTYKKELQKINIALSRFKTSQIIAKEDGYVVRILKNDKNQFIKKGEPVLLFSPVVKKQAVLLKVNSFDMPLIKKNLPVRIQFYGWPTLHISGWPIIRFGTFGGIIDKVDPVAHEKGVYYAYVVEDPEEPWPSPDILRIGTQATVWVRLSTVPIWYEIWRRINAFPPKMVTPTEEK